MNLKMILFLAMLLPFMAAAAYAADACYGIQDADARNYCLAKARGDRGACYNIQRSDLRSLCLSEVGK